MPPGREVTTPPSAPVPVLLTVSTRGARSKVAVTERATLMVTLQVVDPLQSPLQPMNVEFAAAIADRVTTVPLSKEAVQFAPQVMPAGALVTVPAPEEACMDPEEAEEAAAQAAREADAAGIHGPQATPWLLRRVVELTDGRSMTANTALLANNGRIAAEIAVALSNN